MRSKVHLVRGEKGLLQVSVASTACYKHMVRKHMVGKYMVGKYMVGKYMVGK